MSEHITDEIVDEADAIKAADSAPQAAPGGSSTPVVTMAQAVSLTPPADVRTALHAILSELNAQFFERGDVIQAMMLATLAKEHCFILGPPGTAKSALTRAFFDRFVGAEYFEAILSKSRPAEAILGPFDIPELRDHGHLFRKINNFLPTANFAMLDEVGKMSPTLGHDLLAVVLERRLHQVNGGRSWIDVPLYTFIGGSNELPTDESDDAAALWDRMLVRVVVDQVQEAGNFIAMISGAGTSATPTRVDFASLAHVIDVEVPAIGVPKDVLDTLVQLREVMRAEEYDPSGRRWKQCMKLLKASAWLADRTEVTVDDIGVLRHALWEKPEQIDKVERLTLQVSNPFAEAALKFMERVKEIASEVTKAKPLAVDKRAQIGVQLGGQLKTLQADIGKERQKAITTGASTTKLDEILGQVNATRRAVYKDCLDMDLDAGI
jgi:MoxR-like ATPase